MTVAPNDSIQSLARLIEAASRLMAHMHHAGRATDPNEEIAVTVPAAGRVSPPPVRTVYCPTCGNDLPPGADVAAAIAAERARAVADLRAAVEELAEEWAALPAIGSVAAWSYRNAGLREAADRLRAVLNATSEQQP